MDNPQVLLRAATAVLKLLQPRILACKTQVHDCIWDCAVLYRCSRVREKRLYAFIIHAAKSCFGRSNDRGVSYSQEELFHLLKSKNVVTLDKQRKIEPGLLAKTMCVVEHMPPLLYT